MSLLTNIYLELISVSFIFLLLFIVCGRLTSKHPQKLLMWEQQKELRETLQSVLCAHLVFFPACFLKAYRYRLQCSGVANSSSEMQPHLYDGTSPDHRHKQLVQNSWEETEQECESETILSPSGAL